MTTTAIKQDYAYDFAAIIAENIRALAARRGYNQKSLANALGLANGTISMRWNGKRDWPLNDIARVAEVLDTTPWALCQPAPEYDTSRVNSPASVYQLPRLDSNQQPFDYALSPVTDLSEWRRVAKCAA